MKRTMQSAKRRLCVISARSPKLTSIPSFGPNRTASTSKTKLARPRAAQRRKVSCRHGIFCVDEEILRVYGRGRTAQVGCHGPGTMTGISRSLAAYGVQNEHCKGYKSDERDVVSDEHGREKRQHEYQRHAAQAPPPRQYPLGHDREEASPFRPSTTAIRQNSRQSTRRSMYSI